MPSKLGDPFNVLLNMADTDAETVTVKTALLQWSVGEIDRLQAIVVAKDGVIDWYEEDLDRANYDDADIPEELLELEQAVKAAKAAGGNDGQ